MAERSVVVRLRAEVSDFKRAMAEAAQAADKIPESTRRADTALGQMVQSAQYNREAWDRTGRTMATFGTLTVGGLALAGKAAVDWESQWTGVTKTVSGSSIQLEALQEQLRQMARELPATHEEIAAVAEAAGQLGIKTENIAAFTRTMIDLGETTNLTAQDAATGLARFANVMGTAQTDFDRLGSVIVGLGNNYATTESEILDMAQRLASASRVVGLSEADTLGLAAAMSSVGIEAEAGGSAVSRVMIKISQAVDDGGDNLDQFAQVAGMSSAQFADQWANDPVAALLAVVQGLSKMTETGQGTFGMLQELGLNDIRVTNALLSMSNATELTTAAVAQASDEWERNNALAAEAAKRYDTAQAKIEIARNSIVDAAISLGETFLPAVASAAQGVADFAGWLAQLPEPVQQVAGQMGGLVGTVALLGGAFLTITPRLLELRTAYRQLRSDNAALASGLTRVAKVAGLAAVAATVLQIADAAQQAKVNAAELANSMQGLADGATTVSDVFDRLPEGTWGNVLDPNDVDAMAHELEYLTRVQNNSAEASRLWLNDLIGTDSGARTLSNSIHEIGRNLGDLTGTNLTEAQRQFNALNQAFGGTEESAGNLLHIMPGYRDALLATATAAGMTLDDTSLLALATGNLTLAQDAAASSTSDVADATAAANDQLDAAIQLTQEWRDAVSQADASFVDLAGAYQGVIDKNTEIAQAAADATDSMSDSWEDFYDGQTVSAEDYIAQLQAQVDAQAAWEQNLLDISGRVRDGMTGDMRTAAEQMIDELLNLGPDGAAQVQLLHDMTDEQFAKVVELWSQKGTDAVAEFTSQVESYRNPVIPVEADTTPADRTVQAWIQTRRIASIEMRATLPDLNGSASGSGRPGLAEGGEVPGPYIGPTADNVLIRANPKEWVHSVAAVDFWGTGFMDSVNRRDLASVVRSLPGRASGGQVGYAPAPGYMTVVGGSFSSGSAPSLAGLEIVGTLDTPWGPAQMRGMVREEIASAQRSRTSASARGVA
ncbi:phage tail tape measure protein [Actinotalea sp. M2MS4P-6]|uniref:phage tail tape measure protein n=1 Tax=Actinotalea sp. M2MS4P-6 TaxID=2983762 RepID=UPI0021E4E0B4|nr:phage tail tape measure protein [Actinotalea sp. M2MS4P-6]MCV2395918.1 phage tail tape measure protein [Actinotalea sp. M2MS4P-6]